MTTVHPGDVIQITDPTDRWFPALLVVDTVRAWGCTADALVPRGDQPVGVMPYRVKAGSFEVIGQAAIITKDQATARAASISTAAQAAAEAPPAHPAPGAKGDG